MKRLVKKNKVNDMFAAIIKAMLYSYKKNNSNIKIADLYEEDDYELKLINALDDLTDYNDTEPIVKLLPLIRQNNPESLYNGTVYRKYFFDKNILNNANVTFNEEVTEMYISRSELENVIRSQIRTGKPQSTTKSLESCHIFNLTDIDTPLEVTTQFEAKDGIDIVALSENFSTKKGELAKFSSNPFSIKYFFISSKFKSLISSILYFFIIHMPITP